MQGKQLNPFQHALSRPDNYIGSIQTVDANMRVLNMGENKVSFQDVKFNRGLMNIIREIGSNCIDNKWRSEKAGVPMRAVTVDWNFKEKKLVFWNDGVAIPVKKFLYKYEDYRKDTIVEEELYPAEVHFGEMLAGTNLDDTVERKTSGKNGMGSKATCVFSTFFNVEHTDAEEGKKFKQTYTQNGRKRTQPKITIFKNKTSFTQISFCPDFERFNYDIENNETDFIGLLGVQVLEIAAMTALPVTFTVNSESKKYHFKTFDKFVRLLYPDTKNKIASITLENGDECIIAETYDEKDDLTTLDNIQHLSYVNGAKTRNGGVHVDAWKAAIFPSFVKMYNEKTKGNKTSGKDVYPYLTMFLRTEMDKPSFDEQTKDVLNGPAYKLPKKESFKEQIDSLIQKMLRWDFVKLLDAKLMGELPKAKTIKNKVRLGEKFQEANNVKNEPHKCKLYITEGRSAKSMVVRGISSMEDGQNYNGIFAIQGKFINVLNLTYKTASKNKEFLGLLEVLNLKPGLQYKEGSANFKTLRYQNGVCIMTDMDDDGIHIRGLLLCLFYKWWPELVECGYVTSLSTYVTKVIFKLHTTQPKGFYSNPEYEKWYQTANKEKISEVKYLKGLASINPEDAPDFFLNPQVVTYTLEGDEKDYMNIGFCNQQKSIALRKQWILRDMRPEDSIILSRDEEEFTYNGPLGLSTFVDRDLVVYHRMTLRRALPHLMDGLKESQRKILYGILLKNYKTTQDLERVSGAIKELTGYHHGSASLMGAIKNLAIRYPGSNNIPLLQSDGEFGTRLAGPSGEDSGEARYVKTMLESITEVLFPSIDNNLLSHVFEDNIEAEFEFFVPILPMLLINGSDGISCGFRAGIPCYNPEAICNWVLAWLDGKSASQKSLLPWYRDITGEISLIGDSEKNSWESKGVLKQCHKGCDVSFFYREKNSKKYKSKTCDKKNPSWWHITDLPVGKWSGKYQTKVLDYLETGSPPEGTNKEKLESHYIIDSKSYCTANKVHFMIQPVKGWTPSIDDPLLKLKTTYSLNCMVAIDSNDYPTFYKSPEHILDVWCPKRLTFYQKRYDWLMNSFKKELLKAENRYNFVDGVIRKKIDMNQTKSKVTLDLERMGFVKDDVSLKETSSFNYLLNMKMWSMTIEKMEELQQEIEKITIQIQTLTDKTAKDLWREDLAKFKDSYKEYIKKNPLY